MKSPRFIFAIAILLSFCSCKKTIGDGPTVTEQRSVGTFTGIEFSTSGTLNFTQAPNYKVEISAQQNILNVIESYVSNNQLVLKIKNGTKLGKHDPITITVSGPSVEAFHISGSGNINTTGAYTIPDMALGVSGSGNINMEQLNATFLDANISGSGNIKVAGGTATEELLRISGSGSIEIENVVANKAVTTTSGSGHTKVQALQTLKTTISGSGSVYYKGNPVITASISGSGKLSPL